MHPLARMEELLADFQTILAKYERKLLDVPGHLFYQGQVSQLKDQTGELTNTLNELKKEQAVASIELANRNYEFAC